MRNNMESERHHGKHIKTGIIIAGGAAVGVATIVGGIAVARLIKQNNPKIMEVSKVEEYNPTENPDSEEPFSIITTFETPIGKSEEDPLENTALLLAPISVDDVEFVEMDGETSDLILKYTISISDEKWQDGWRLGDLWGKVGDDGVTMDNATLIMTWEGEGSEGSTVTQLENGRHQIIWETSLYPMGEPPVEGDVVSVGANLARQGENGWEEDEISPYQMIINWDTNLNKRSFQRP